jgi:hypothetical protein
MNTEEYIMYVNLPGELYSVVSGVAIERDVAIGRALEAIISEWSKNMNSEPLEENKENTDSPNLSQDLEH